jgi:Fe-S-cluster-containing dehydrogenase component
VSRAFLVDLDRCIGCFACEIACKDENDLASGVRRVKVKTVDVNEFNRFYVPVFNVDKRGVVGCTLCPQLQAEGRRPACVNNCLTNALDFGESEEIEANVEDSAREWFVTSHKRAKILYVSKKQISDQVKEEAAKS